MTNNEIAIINGYIEDLNVNNSKLASDAYEANLEALMELNQIYFEKIREYKELALTDADEAAKLQADIDA